MISDALLHALQIIEQKQQDCPTAYDCIETELNCLKKHMKVVLKYLEPLTVGDLDISLPKTIEKLTGTRHITSLYKQ